MISASVKPTGRNRRFAALVAAAIPLIGSAPPAMAQDSGISLLRDAEIEEVLHRQADPLFIVAGINPADVNVLLIGSKDLNAFAAPRTMAVYTGLILQAENPNQLKGVIAHEIGHLAGGHSARSDEMARAGLRPMILTMGLGVLAVLAGAGDAGAALLGNATYFGQLGALSYSREQEGRADQAGLTFLEKTHQSGRGLVEFFDNFRYQEVFTQAKRFPYFQSHPLSSDRIELLRSRAEAQPSYGVTDKADDIADLAMIKAKIEGFTNPKGAFIEYSEKDNGLPARYARAIAYYQMKEPDRALAILDGMLKEAPNNAYFWELKGQILFEFGRAAEAEVPQRRSVALKPDQPLLHVNLGQTLVSLDDPKKRGEGILELRKALTVEGDNTVAWRLLADAYDKNGDNGLARLATAESYFSVGAKRESRTFAFRALELLPKGTPEWRRATDIVLVSQPSDEDLKRLAKQG